MFQTNVAPHHPFHAIMWKNGAEWGRPQMTIWCMHKACWTTETTETWSLYVIRIAFPLQ